MARGKPLTQDEIKEIRRLKRERDTVKGIEDKTGFSHTVIVKYTKGNNHLLRHQHHLPHQRKDRDAYRSSK